MDPLLGGPCVVQIMSFLEGQVGSEWSYACEGASEPGIGTGEGDRLSAWTLWNSSCPGKVIILLIFLLGILGSKSTRELKNFSFLPKWHHPMWGSACSLGSVAVHLIFLSDSFGQTWLASCQTPLILPSTPLPGAAGTWPHSQPARGSLGMLPGVWPVPPSGRSAPAGDSLEGTECFPLQ